MGQNSMAVILEITNVGRLELAGSYVISQSQLAVSKNGLPQQTLIFFNEQSAGSLYSLLYETLWWLCIDFVVIQTLASPSHQSEGYLF